MSSFLQEVSDEIKKYERLCNLYNEEPLQDEEGDIDPYLNNSQHLKELKERYESEISPE